MARSACHHETPWTSKVVTVVSLGTPHLGAPLEKAVHVIDWVMRRVPESEPIGRVLANRSAESVKDLRFGSLVEDDWRDQGRGRVLRQPLRRGPLPAVHDLVLDRLDTHA